MDTTQLLQTGGVGGAVVVGCIIVWKLLSKFNSSSCMTSPAGITIDLHNVAVPVQPAPTVPPSPTLTPAAAPSAHPPAAAI